MEDLYVKITERFLEEMRKVKGTQEEFLEGLGHALQEIEVEIQACKETM